MLRLQHASPLDSTLWALQAVPLGAHRESPAATLTLLSVMPMQHVAFNVKCRISKQVALQSMQHNDISIIPQVLQV